MKALTHCPKCHELLTDSLNSKPKSKYLDCIKYTTHSFLSNKINDNDNQLSYIQIGFCNNNLRMVVSWNFPCKEVKICSSVNLRGISIPYFDPEPYMNNYDKLINKLKLYILFL
jgi:hypothetical protein